jgi:perosamine synthetase
MVTCNDDALARQVKLLRSHGETEKYVHEQVGYNYRMNDITGAIGCSRLDRLDAETRLRQQAAARFDQVLAGINGIAAPASTPGAIPVYHLYVCRMDLSKFRCTRDEFCAALKAEGVPTAVHYPRSLTRQPAFARFVTDHAPVADRLPSEVFALPIHHALTEDHFRTIAEALKKVSDALRA